MTSQEILDWLETARKNKDSGWAQPVIKHASIAEIIKALQSATGRSRGSLCYILGKRQAKSALPYIVALLDDPDSSIRFDALDAVGDIGAPKYGALLLERLQRELDYDTRSMLVIALSHAKYLPAAPLLRQILREKEPSPKDGRVTMYVFAARALGYIQVQEAEPEIKEAITAEQNDWARAQLEDSRRWMQRGEHTQQKAQELLAFMRSHRKLNAQDVAYLLHGAQEVIEPAGFEDRVHSFICWHASADVLRETLRQSDATTRAAICTIITQREIKSAAPDLIPFIEDPDWRVRRAVAFALSYTCSPRSASKIGALVHQYVRTLSHNDERYEYLRRALINLKYRPAIPDFVAALGDPEARESAAYALGRIGDSKAIQALSQH